VNCLSFSIALWENSYACLKIIVECLMCKFRHVHCLHKGSKLA